MTTLSNPKAGDTAFVSTFSLGAGDGPTVAVKDCIDIAGMTTRCGSAAYAGARPATAHAPVIERLLSAGCRIVGKARMHEIAYGMTGVNAFEGTPLNPRWPDRVPGGSSSGSAVAVAAGAVDFAIGTDTGGSVRQPAICCGVIGLKPTFGLVDRTGALPAESSLDCIGPFACDMTMIERAMTAIAPGYAPVSLDHAPRLGRLDLKTGIAPEMVEAFEAINDHVAGAVTLSGMDDAFKAAMAIIARETLAANLELLNAGAPFGDDIRARLEGARAVGDADIEAAEQVRRRFTDEVDAALETFDAIVTPALPSPPPLLSEAHDPNKVLPLTRFLRPFNLSGHPAIALPAPTSGGLPSGVQIIARRGEDALLCALARRLCETYSIFQVKDY